MEMTNDELFNQNVKLVHYIVNHCFKDYIYEKEDLTQEGMIGLWKACKSYNESYGYKFSTFATICIKNQIQMYLRPLYKERLNCQKIVFADLEPYEQERLQSDETFENVDVQYLFKELLKNLPEEDQKLLLLLKDGYTQCQLAKLYKVSQTSISRRVRQIKFKLNREKPFIKGNMLSKNSVLSEMDIRFLELYQSHTKKEIQEMLGISERTYYRKLSKIKEFNLNLVN